jgi:uncharacterized protein
MKNAFIFHGTGGYPEENWFPWMSDELNSLGFDVHIPQFPTPENQTLENWFDVLNQYQNFIDQNTLMIGHSLGGAFLLRVLESIRTQIAAACIVSAPVGIRPILNWEGDQPFIGHSFDWKKIREHSKDFIVFHSDNDPYVSFGNGEETAKQLGVELRFIPNAGHFNKAAGYIQFPELLDKIRVLLSKV